MPTLTAAPPRPYVSHALTRAARRRERIGADPGLIAFLAVLAQPCPVHDARRRGEPSPLPNAVPWGHIRLPD